MAVNIGAYNVILTFANLAKATLAGAITNTATAAQLASGTGSLFPAPLAGQGYVGTFIDAATGLLNEIVLVTAVSGDQIVTMVRAQESTTALNWNTGDFFYMQPTAGTMASMTQAGQASPARVITSSISFTLNNADGAVGLARVTSLAAQSITFPVTPINGQIIRISDLIGNFNAYPVTMIPNSGQNIAGLPGNAVLKTNRGVGAFEFFLTGTNQGTWSFGS